MSFVSFLLIIIGVLLNAAGQLLLKAGVRHMGVIKLHFSTLLAAGSKLAFEPHILGGLACYVVSVAVWILALSRVPVSIAYPVLSLGYVVVAVASWFLFGETLGAIRIAGIAVIIVGVYLVAKG